MILDIIWLLVLLLSIVHCARRGLLLSIVNLLQWIISFALAIYFCSDFKAFLAGSTDIGQNLDHAVTDLLSKQSDTSKYHFIPELFGNMTKESSEQYADTIISGATSIVLSIIAFLVILLACRLVFLLIIAGLRRHRDATRHTVLGTLSTIAGAILGAGLGFVYTLILMALAVPLVVILPDAASQALQSQLNESVICKLLYDDNFLLILTNWIIARAGL